MYKFRGTLCNTQRTGDNEWRLYYNGNYKTAFCKTVEFTLNSLKEIPIMESEFEEIHIDTVLQTIPVDKFLLQ